MSEKLADRIAAAVGRRGFMATLSAASAAFVLGVFKPQNVKAGVQGLPQCGPGTFPVGACCLAFDPRFCTYGDCGCEWVWKRVTNEWSPETEGSRDKDPSAGHQPEHEERFKPLFPIEPSTCRRYSCWECYRPGSGTSGENCNCTGSIACSKATYTTIVCAG
jgi:hypothetical protein